MNKEEYRCEACKGNGHIKKYYGNDIPYERTCPYCQGFGKIFLNKDSEDTCPNCKGFGYERTWNGKNYKATFCLRCNGTGRDRPKE